MRSHVFVLVSVYRTLAAHMVEPYRVVAHA